MSDDDKEMVKTIGDAVAARLLEDEGFDPKEYIMRKLPKRGPHLIIRFLDPPHESLILRCKRVPDAYFQGSHMHPGFVPEPTNHELRQIGGKGGLDGGHYFMERVHSAMYEGEEPVGTMGGDDPDDLDDPDYDPEIVGLWFRPLHYTYVNCDDPYEE